MDKFGFDEEKVKTSVGELGTVITGNTPSKSKDEYWDSEDICFVKPDGIADAGITYISKSSEYMSEAAREKARVVTKDAIFVTCIGSIGKIGIAEDGEFAFNQQINTIVPNDRVIPKYLAYNLLYSKTRLSAIANSAVVPIINKSQFSEFEIKIVEDKAKQGKIVDGLDFVARIIDKKKQQLEELDTLIKARFVEMFGDPRFNEYNFEKKMLRDTCKVVTGNTPSRAVDEYYGDYIEWIKTDNIVSGQLTPTTASESLSAEGMQVGRTVDEDAILMACIAGSVASIGRVCVTDRKVAFNQQINAIVPQEYNTLFLYTLLQISKDYLVEEINMALKGILSKSRLEEKTFIVPPMEVQDEFADFVTQVDKLKVVVQESLDELQTLFDSLMQQYFG